MMMNMMTMMMMMMMMMMTMMLTTTTMMIMMMTIIVVNKGNFIAAALFLRSQVIYNTKVSNDKPFVFIIDSHSRSIFYAV